MREVVEYKKLVRNNVPREIIRDGKTAVIRKLNDAEFGLALCDKLVEEVGEYLEAASIQPESIATKSDRVSELVDILEVVETLALRREGITLKELLEKQSKKNVSSGSFSDRVFLERTE